MGPGGAPAQRAQSSRDLRPRQRERAAGRGAGRGQRAAARREPLPAPRGGAALRLRPHHRRQPGDGARLRRDGEGGGDHATVLITGETGTGKDLVARAIHYAGPRKEARFVAQNCGALPDTLLESELFGHRRGAFTGAHQDKKGLFELAHGGTIFLDEIGETNPGMQVRLLRVLQDGEVRPLGSSETRKVDVRVIAATNRDLRQMVDRGDFREDLFYRLRVVELPLPALRERPEDIPPLAEHFLERAAESMGKTMRGFTHSAMNRLTGYPWPGNVRELENEIERAVALAGDADTVTAEMLSDHV
ncbi:MAG: AAA domain-containing protein, partial [Gammaproteobacteria bacterium]|nr:AAA domain-containing protein [Gammaproteobacteria bacterium]